MTGPKRPDSRRIGQEAERQATEFLRRRGFRILETNVRFTVGELDIVAEDGPSLVFVEVRARHSTQYGSPEESVTFKKQRRVYRAAEMYLQTRNLKQDRPMRIDVVAIDLKPDGAVGRIALIEDAFSER